MQFELAINVINPSIPKPLIIERAPPLFWKSKKGALPSNHPGISFDHVLLFSKERRSSYFCQTYIEGGVLSTIYGLDSICRRFYKIMCQFLLHSSLQCHVPYCSLRRGCHFFRVKGEISKTRARGKERRGGTDGCACYAGYPYWGKRGWIKERKWPPEQRIRREIFCIFNSRLLLMHEFLNK